MKIVLISDCHNTKFNLGLRGDEEIIIHAGDMTQMGSPRQVKSFIEWFSSLPVKHKITIAGNHDFCLDRGEGHRYPNEFGITVHEDFCIHDIIYLQDSSIIIDGIEIFGSPWSPEFGNWAFNQRRGQPAKERWDRIPLTSDIVVTHTPVAYHLDRTVHGDNVGCYELYDRLTSMDKKILHVCGHIHEGYGIKKINEKLVTVNASVLDEDYRLKHRPIVYTVNTANSGFEYTDFDYLTDSQID